jgi:hypothetical protein
LKRSDCGCFHPQTSAGRPRHRGCSYQAYSMSLPKYLPPSSGLSKST